MEEKYKRKLGENELDYAMRLIEMKKNKDENLDWQDIVDLLGLNLNRDSLRKSQDTEFGGYAVYNEMRKRMVLDNSNCQYDLEEQIQELKKERMKLSEERASLNRKLKTEARMEQLCEMIIKSAEIMAKENPIKLEKRPEYEDNENYAVLLLSDIHYGLNTSTINNEYNEEVFKERFELLLEKTVKFIISEDIRNIYVLGLGDLINGVIHISTRLENKENIIDQVLKFSEYLVHFLSKLSLVANVYYYQVVGNHGRVFSKDESFNNDNFEILIKHYVKARIGNYITICENELNNEIGHLKIEGKDYLFAHGHRDNIKNVADKLFNITNIKPTAIFLGHTHSPQMFCDNKTEIYVNGNLCGNNEYAENLRVMGEPSQTLLLLDRNGIKYHYIVKV